MPISIEDVLKAPQQPAQPAQPGSPPPSDGVGLPIASLFQKKEGTTSSAAKQLGSKAVATVKDMAAGAGNHVLRPYLDDAVQWSKEYGKAVDEDLRAYPEGTGNQVLHSLKTANDMIGFALGPVLSPINTGLVKPVRAAIGKLGSLIEAHAAEDTYDAQARREGATGQQYPKGRIDWAVHKADVKRTVSDLQDASEALINAGVAMVSPETIRGKPLRPTPPVAAARAEAAKTAPEVPADHVRYYHGGAPAGATGPLWFTTSLEDAKGWASRAQDMKVWYVDVPKGHSARGEGDLANGISYPSRVELPADLASRRKPLPSSADPTVHLPQQTAGARASLLDATSALKGKDPALVPIAVSLDKSMGFQKVAANAGLEKIPVGSNRTAASLFDDMLPHADGYAKSFMEKLQQSVPPDLTIQFRRLAGFDSTNLGVYMPEMKQIQIKAGSKDMVHTTLHEMVHASTIHAIDSLIEGDLKARVSELGRPLTNEEKFHIVGNPSSPLLRDLDSVIKEARIRALKAGQEFYALKKPPMPAMGNLGDLSFLKMTPRYEFVAELFTDPKFQEFLANSEKYASAGYRAKNLLNKFAEVIGKHLGITAPGELKLLNQSLQVGSRLMKMQGGQDVPQKSIVQIVARTEDGETITRGDIKMASMKGPRDPVGLQRAKNALQISVEAMLRTVNVEALGEKAKLAAAVVASRITEQMQKTSAWQHGSKVRGKFWDARPDLAKEFINKFERGQEFSDPVLRDLAEKYRNWNAEIFAQDGKISKLEYEPRDNYLYHVFEDSEGVSNYFERKYGSKWGDPRFIKDRTFDLYAEAIEAGFVPKYHNPEDILLTRQHASDIAAMHTKILEDLERYGLATKKIKGGTKLATVVDAEGKASLELQKVEGTKQPEGTQRWRAPNGEVYWVSNDADAVMQNAFKSKSLWADKSLVGMGFRGMMALKNALVPIKLAVSLFHPLHVTGIDMAASWTRTTAGMLSGTTSPVKALGEYLRGGFGPLYENPKAGWRVMKLWRGEIPKGLWSDVDTAAMKTIIEGGMIPEMSSQYRLNARQNFGKALRASLGEFRGGRALKGGLEAAKATWHLPWATLSAMSVPIFEYWIPALKTASYLRDAKSLLERNPELAENDAQRQMALRKIAKSVDNRYGEMAYNTLFWKRWVKDLAVLDTLSLGWQLGFLREYGGGLMDVGQFATGGNKLQRIQKGQLDRPLFVATYTALGAATAGLMTYGMTGEYPKDLLDWISPRTGEKNPDGTDQRVSTMFYSREFAALYKHMQNQGIVSGLSQMALNKGSGLFGMMHEWATGLNDFGQEIRDPDGDAFQKLEQTLAYTMSDLEPISMKAIQEQAGEKTGKEAVLSVLGFTPAPKYLTETATQAAIKQSYDKYVAPKQTPYEKAEFSREYTALRKAYQTGDDGFGEMLDTLSEKYQLSSKDQRRIMKSLNSDLSSDVRMFMRLPWQEQIKMLDKATPEERDQLLVHANREHVRNVYVPPEDR